MTPYYVLLIVPMVLSIFEKNKNKNYSIILYFILYLLLLALRDESVGIDLNNYQIMFNMFNESDTLSVIRDSTTEPGFIVLNRVIGYFGNFRLLLIVVSILIVLPLLYYYKKKSDDSLLVIVLFMAGAYFMIPFSALRQALAISLSLPIFFLLLKGKILLPVLLFLLAMTFHRSSVIMILFYPLIKLKIRRIHLPFICVLFVFCLLFKQQIFSFLISMLPTYSSVYGDVQNTGAFMMTLFYSLMSLVSFIVVDENRLNDEDFALRNLLLAISFIQIFSAVGPVVMRINYYFIVFFPIIMARMLSKQKSINSELSGIIKLIVIVFFTFYYIYNAGPGDLLQIYPYKLMNF